jgi:DNA-binding HxlR family transcriptional regulator
MRGYQQVCGIAKGLELVGDRWTLLIVRELLIREACRYTDLRNGLPGIATNLLAHRLRDLESALIIYSEHASPPVAAAVYRLTDRGRALEPVINAIADWGRPLLAESDPDAVFQTHWIVLALRTDLEDTEPEQGPIRVQIEADDESIVVEAADGVVDARVGRVNAPDLTLRGPGRVISRLLLGNSSLPEARNQGVETIGDSTVLKRLHANGPEQRTAPSKLASTI